MQLKRSNIFWTSCAAHTVDLMLDAETPDLSQVRKRYCDVYTQVDTLTYVR